MFYIDTVFAAISVSLFHKHIITAFRLEVLTGNGPPDDTVLDSQRKLRQNEVAAQAVFRRLVIYAIFVFVIFSVGYINRDSRSYNIRRNIDNQIFYTTKETYGFENVRITIVLKYERSRQKI